MSKKKYDPKYIEDANKRLWNILNDKKEFDDWTQISLSVQNAVQAAANLVSSQYFVPSRILSSSNT